MTIKERLLALGYTGEQADQAIRAHLQNGKMYELERYISIKETVEEVLG